MTPSAPLAASVMLKVTQYPDDVKPGVALQRQEVERNGTSCTQHGGERGKLFDERATEVLITQ